jgi:hypothetical protein
MSRQQAGRGIYCSAAAIVEASGEWMAHLLGGECGWVVGEQSVGSGETGDRSQKSKFGLKKTRGQILQNIGHFHTCIVKSSANGN